MKCISKGAKSAIVYTFSTILSRGLAIITVPIFTRLMSPDQIGVVNLYNSWYALISSVATLSLTSGGYSLAMKLYSKNRDEYQSSILSLTTLIALLISSLYFLFPEFWISYLGLPKELIMLMLFGFIVAPATDFWLARQRYEYKYKTAGALTMISAILASTLSVVAVIYAHKNQIDSIASVRLYANYFVLYGVATILWIYTFIKGKELYNKEYWKFSLTLSLPLVGYSIASQILNVSDRMMISKMVGNSAVGIYTTLYTVSSLSLILWQAIHSSFVPYLFQNIEADRKGIKNNSLRIILLYSIIAILMTYAAPEIVRIIATEEYYDAILIMPPIAAGVYFTALVNIYSDIPVYYKTTKYVMYPAIIAAVLNLVLNYIFISMFGYMAAAYTTMISYIVMAILQVYWASKVCTNHGFRLEYLFLNKKMFYVSIITIFLCLLATFLYDYFLLRYLFILFLFILVIFYIKEYTK